MPSRISRPSAFGNAQHHALARTVDVRIEQAHLRALTIERQRQVHGRGRFTNPAFAGRHSNDVFDLRHAAAGRCGEKCRSSSMSVRCPD